MKVRKERKGKLFLGVLALVFVLGTGLMGDAFTLIARAENQAKVTANSVKIRKEATTQSDMVGGADNGALLTVLSQQQGSDGYTWYQIQYNNISGYVRGDLVQLTEGSAPPEGGSEGGGGSAPPQNLTQVNPVEATVSEQSGRIRSEASVSGQILVEVQNGTALTVTGQLTDGEGKTWYQVSYSSGETSAQGYIRGDYVTLSGELQPAGDPGAATDPDPAPSVSTKKYETVEQADGWYLVETETNNGYSIDQLMQMNTNAAANNAAYEESIKTEKQQKIIIIILVFLLVAAVAGIAFLVYKVRDLMDSAYFNAVENETIRKRTKGKDEGREGREAREGREGRETREGREGREGGRKVMHTVGTEKQPARPAGTRPAGTPQGQRPAGTPQRPAGVSQGQRPVGVGQRAAGAGQRPAGVSQGQRPAGAPQGQRPAGAPQGQRPAGTPQGQRPAGTPQGQRPAGASQGQRPAGAPQGQRPAGAPQSAQGGTRRAKNFMLEDDEFEYDYLNYDGDGSR